MTSNGHAGARQPGITSEVAPDDEFVHEHQTGGLWSENYCFWANDPSSSYAIYVQHSRSRLDPMLWREALMVFCPDDKRLVSKAFGNHRESRGPCGSFVTASVIEPLRRWSFEAHGMARPVTDDQLRLGLLTDGTAEPFAFTLLFECTGTAWAFDQKHGAQDWAIGHYEQAGRMSGELLIGGQAVLFDGLAYRDHSWGPRDLTDHNGSVFLHGEFPSGRSFVVLGLHARSGPGLAMAVVDTGSGPALMTANGVTIPSALPKPSDRWDLQLAGPAGVIDISVELSAQLTGSYLNPYEFMFGDGGDHTFFECPARLQWDDEAGAGFYEGTTTRTRAR